MKTEGIKQLFEEFPEITSETWKERIISDLKGAGNLDLLTWKTDEGIHVKPYYRSEDLEPLDYLENSGSLKRGGATPNHWTICQEIIPDDNVKETNSSIRSALAGGAEALRIMVKDHPAPSLEMLGSMLEAVPISQTEILFHGSLGADALFRNLIDLMESLGLEPADLKGSLGADPLGKMATTGIPIASMENLGNLVGNVRKISKGLRVIEVDGALFQNSGATLVDELAFSLAMASDYMAALTDSGLDPLEAQESIHLRLAAGSNYFMEIAKLRAARILWGKISSAYGIAPEKGTMRIHSVSSMWNMTLYDPYINMLRGTTEAMSSIIGGADLVSVLPFNIPYGKSDEFSDRIARNVQVILREETYFDRVSDPSSGSYYVENLTHSMVLAAWDLFCRVELKGGFRKAFEEGWIQEHINSSRNKKIERTTFGNRKILGTNAYPVFNELILENLEIKVEDESPDLPLIPLRPFRLASIFESVRLDTEKSGKRPRVLLFRYGKEALRNTRASFAGNFFGCGGYEILTPPAFNSVDEGIEAAIEQRAELVVLCSSDDEYPKSARRILESLRGISIIVIAGYPVDSVEALRSAGIGHFIHSKSNLLDTLKSFNQLLI